MSARFVPETTTSPDYLCWTLYGEGDEILGSTVTRSGVPEGEAREKLIAEKLYGARLLAKLDRLAQEQGDG